MKTRIQKWGGSFVLRIPKSFASEIGLHEGMLVEVTLTNGTLKIAPVVESKFTLEQLLEKVNDENLHHGVETGPAVGNEVW